MEKEYKVAPFKKVFYSVCAGGVAIFFAVMPFFTTPQNKLVLLLPLFILVGCILAIINLFKSCVRLTSNSISRERLFYSKTLNFDAIKGARVGSKMIVIEPVDASLKSLKITNYDDLAKSETLVNWIRTTFVDLNEEDWQKEKEALLNDNSLGYTPKEREAKISMMRQVAIAYNIWGFIMCMVLIFVQNNSLSFWTGAIYPLLGIIIMRFSSGLIKFAGASQRSLPMGVSLGMAMAVINVFMVAIAEYEVLSFANAWPIIAVVTTALLTLLYITGTNKIEGAAKGQIVAMLATAFIYAFGNIIVINCLFDKSSPVNFTTTVADEYISSGKGAHYHLKLNSWKVNGRIREVDVSRKNYEKAPIGSSIIISEKKGLFHIPWFYFKVDPGPPSVAN